MKRRDTNIGYIFQVDILNVISTFMFCFEYIYEIQYSIFVYLQTTRTVQDVPSLESRSNGMIFKDVSSNYPITSHTNINSSCSKVLHAFGQTHFLQNLTEDKMEHIRKTMIKHEEMFKEQVLIFFTLRCFFVMYI